MAANFIMNIMNSGATRMLGGALGGGLVVIMIMRLFRNYGTEVAIICLIGVIIAVLFIILIYYLYKNYEVHRQQKLDAELEKKAIEKQRKDRLEKNVASLKSNWQQAMEDIKRSGINIYDLPWFMMIGEPQSGKTTLLRESNLNVSTEKCMVEGAGGTANCNWWFFNDAVLLDTAGRFSMPVTNLPDQDEWLKFLDILMSSRPRCPINGIIVAIPLTSLLEDSESEIQRKAKNIQNKLFEINRNLQIEVPIFLMVTKMDLLHGFTEFCFTLKGAEDTQIFGWNREQPFDRPYEKIEFEEQFYTQTERLYHWSLRILRDMPPEGKIEAIFSFSQKFNQIKKQLHKYCEIIFENHKMNPSLLWRGTFFSSGVQKGKEFIDGLGKIVDKDFQAQIKRSMKTRPYFIFNFCKKMFIEKGLVKPSRERNKRQRNIRITAAAITCVFFFISIMMLVPGYKKLKDQVLGIHKPLQFSQSFIRKKDTDIDFEKTLPDIISNTDKLHQAIHSINESVGTKRFLHGAHNKLYEGLNQIATAMIIKGLYRPFFKDAAKMLSMKSEIAEREKIRPALSQLLRVLSGDQLIDDKAMVLFDLFDNQDYWKKYQKPFHQYLQNYNENASSANIITNRPLFKTHLKHGFKGLEQVWKRYPEEQCKKIHDNVESIAKSYQRLIETNLHASLSDIQPKLDDFYEKATMLTGGKSNLPHLASPEYVETECVNDFEFLLKDINDIDPMMRDLQKSGINQCAEIRKKIEKVKSTSMDTYGHIIQSDGQINQQLKHVIDIVKELNAFNNLFTDHDRQLINVQKSDFIKILDKQHAKWLEEKQKVSETVLKEMGAVKPKGWEKDHLKQIIDHVVALKIQHASFEAASYAVSKVLTEKLKESFLRHGDIVPSLARSDYLLEQFKELKMIENWVYAKHVPLAETQSITDDIRNKMITCYGDYIRFWSNTINKYSPAGQFKRISSWTHLRNKLNQQQGIIIDPTAYPLRSFLETVSEKKIIALQEIIGSRRDINQLEERKVVLCARTYGGPLCAELDKYQQQFYEKVETIYIDLDLVDKSELPDVRKKLKQHYSTMDVFNIFIRASSQESIAVQLRTVQRVARRLLNKQIKQIDSQIQTIEDNEKRALREKWQAIQDRWENKVSSLRNSISKIYPFTNASPKIDQQSDKKITVVVNTIRNEFIQTVFDPTREFSKLITEMSQERDSNVMAKELNLDEELFIEKLNAWQIFLFDQSGKPINYHVQIILQKSPKAGELFTNLDIEGFETIDSKAKVKFRFSGTTYKKQKVIWNISCKSTIRFRIYNEETVISEDIRKESICDLTGDTPLSFLGFLTTKGSEFKALDKTYEWNVNIDFPYKTSQRKIIMIPVVLMFKWDVSIPDVITFPK
jgi:cell division protein FtsL